MKDARVKAYEAAKERYAEIGVNTDAVLEQIAKVSLSLHCWQTDDVTGSNPDGQLSGGIQATGNYPGKARNIEEVRKDIEKVKTLLPGNHRLNIHAIYGDFGGQKVDRDQIEPKHFQSWIDWAKANNMKLDFNSTSFSHPKSGNRRCRTATRASATSGSSIRSAAARSPTRWVSSSATRPATTCGFTTIEGPDRRPLPVPLAAEGLAGQDLRREVPEREGCRRKQGVRRGSRKLYGRLARVLYGLCR